MDSLTWFKSVFQRAAATPASLHADLATEQWPDVPLHLVAARLRPPAPAAEDDEDWDAVIARAKMQAASPKAPSPRPPQLPRNAPAKAPSPPPPPPRRNAWAEMPDTPPPSPGREAPARSVAKPGAPGAMVPEATRATLDALVLGGRKKAAPRPAFVARRPADKDPATPLPLARALLATGRLYPRGR
jgi:hypothetical protein